MSKAVDKRRFKEFCSYMAKGIVLGEARKWGMQVPIILEILKRRRLGKSQRGFPNGETEHHLVTLPWSFLLSLPFFPFLPSTPTSVSPDQIYLILLVGITIKRSILRIKISPLPSQSLPFLYQASLYRIPCYTGPPAGSPLLYRTYSQFQFPITIHSISTSSTSNPPSKSFFR